MTILLAYFICFFKAIHRKTIQNPGTIASGIFYDRILLYGDVVQ